VIQRAIVREILIHEQISPYATAYRFGSSTLKNANPHVGKKVVLKLDIRKFFDNMIYPVVKEKVFPKERYSEPNRILLALLCTYKDSLVQGAPTSPAISNIVMRDFDDIVGEWCESRGIAYTRYCDDMTFSGNFDHREVISLVRSELGRLGLFLNDKKTVVLKDGQRKEVTGIVVNEKVSVMSDYKRKIRQQMYYISKFGLEGHISKAGYTDVDALFGKVNYVLSVEKENDEFKRYRQTLRKKMR